MDYDLPDVIRVDVWIVGRLARARVVLTTLGLALAGGAVLLVVPDLFALGLAVRLGVNSLAHAATLRRAPESRLYF